MASTAEDEHFCNRILGIIAQELEVEEQLQDDDFIEFADLGMNRSAAQVIVREVEQQTKLQLSETVFEDFPDVGLFKQHILSSTISLLAAPRVHTPEPGRQVGRRTSQTSVAKTPLSVLIRGNRSKSSNKNMFLLPDGSGSAMAYARIPSLGPNYNLWALNSPFLGPEQVRDFNCTVEELANVWVAEIMSLQSPGPYVIGGWSAGGYYAFEVMKCMHRRSETVEKLVLIDSPCRTKFEAMPLAVVEYLGKHNLMGNWDTKQSTPQWLVNHFAATLKAVDVYTPSAISSAEITLPRVFVIWAKEALLCEEEARQTGLDLDVQVSRFLLERRDDFGPNGWELLFPAGTKMSIATMSGHHFNIVHSPNVEKLGSLLNDVVRHDGVEPTENWRTENVK
ncbi:unnamed protein product [Discula destructiva]